MSDAVLEARKVVHSYGQVNVLRGLILQWIHPKSVVFSVSQALESQL